MVGEMPSAEARVSVVEPTGARNSFAARQRLLGDSRWSVGAAGFEHKTPETDALPCAGQREPDRNHIGIESRSV
jgi:hypothetical protein